MQKQSFNFSKWKDKKKYKSRQFLKPFYYSKIKRFKKNYRNREILKKQYLKINKIKFHSHEKKKKKNVCVFSFKRLEK